MSKALKCDLCGKYYDYYDVKSEKDFNGISLARIDEYRNVIRDNYIDICPNCKNEFNKLINVLKKE